MDRLVAAASPSREHTAELEEAGQDHEGGAYSLHQQGAGIAFW